MSGFATDKVRALLVYLALEADIPHRRESLAALLYPDYADSDALNNLRKTLFRLRAALDAVDPTLSEQLLLISRASIQLQSSALDVDVSNFRHALATLSSPTRVNDQDVPLLQTAVDGYRGELAAGLALADAQPFEEWLVLQRETLHQRALYLCDVLASVYERRGDFVAAQGVARRALALEPWREEVHAQLIRLLAFNGQKADALAQFESCTRLLEEEMGVEPSEETVRLVQQVRDGTLAPPTRAEAETPRVRLHRFPMPYTSFVGRDEARQKVVEQLLAPDCRLLTLVGPGGIGKTRLGIQVAFDLAAAEHFPDGLYFIDGVPLTVASELVPAIAGVMGLVLQGNTPVLTQLQNFLRSKSALFVVDNMEQIADGGTPLADLLADCPAIKMLVTSREALHIRAEHRYTLEGLSCEGGIASEAAVLFVQRARQVISHFAPTKEDEAAIIGICETVGGMPLAIEIAATWLRFYDCATIADEIHKGIDFLETEFRDVPARQRSVRAVFHQSWQLLSPSEQRVLRQLSVLRGEWTLPQALAVVKGGPRELVSLGDKSLLRRTKSGRYAIHELLRQFAFERLVENGEQQESETRHTTYFLRLVASYREALFGMDPRPAVAALREELPNVRNGWRYAVSHQAWTGVQEVLPALTMFFELTGLVHEGVALLEEAVSVIQGQRRHQALYLSLLPRIAELSYRSANYDKVLQTSVQMFAHPFMDTAAADFGTMHYYVAWTHFVRGEKGAESHLAQAESLFAQSNNLLGQARAVGLRGQMVWKQGKVEESLDLYHRSIALFEAIEFPIGVSQQLSNCAIVYRMRGQFDKALAYSRRGLVISERLNYPSDLARWFNSIGVIHVDMGEFEEALAAYYQALEYDELLGNRRTIAIERGNIGIVYERMGRVDEALALWQGAIDIAHDGNLKGIEANYMCNRGECFASLGRFEEAKQDLEAGIAIARTIDNRPIVANYMGALGYVYYKLGQLELAMYTLDEALASQAKFTLQRPLAYSMYYKAVILSETDNWAGAAQWAHESILVQQDLNLKDLLWVRATILELMAQTKTGHTVDAVATIQDLLTQLHEEDERAEAYFALWQLSGDKEHHQNAYTLYSRMEARVSRYDQRQKLARLSKK